MSLTIEATNRRFLPEVEEALRRAGWYPGRQVEEDVLQKWYVFRWAEIPGYCRIFPAAYRFLREFGELKLDDGNSPCLIDPLEAGQYNEDLRIFSEWELETRLYPLGVWDTGDFLHVDLQGRFWSLPTPVLMGNNVEETLTNILIPGWMSSHPLQKVDRKPVDEDTENLIERIMEAEQRIMPSQALVLRTPTA